MAPGRSCDKPGSTATDRIRNALPAFGSRSLIVLVIACLTGLFSATTLLASYYHEAKRARAHRHFEQAESLSAGGHLDDAAGAYRAGLALERDNVEAERGLAIALLALGQRDEAATYFADLLRREPTDGPANRGMARIAAAQNRPADASVFYQRAIYGLWPEGMVDARIATRFELVDHLRQTASRDAIHAEVLRLKAEIPAADIPMYRRVARLLLETGAPEEAVDALREAAAAAPRDPALLTDLADSEMKAGMWAAARRTLLRALAVERRKDLGARVALVERVLALDPTEPRLRLGARTRRARRVLAAVFEHTKRCARPEAVAVQEEAQQHLRRRGDVDADAAERDLDLAAQLWSLAPECETDTVEARALGEVLRHVAMTEGQQP